MPKVLALRETSLNSLGEDHRLQAMQGYKAGGRDLVSGASTELFQQLASEHISEQESHKESVYLNKHFFLSNTPT